MTLNSGTPGGSVSSASAFGFGARVLGPSPAPWDSALHWAPCSVGCVLLRLPLPLLLSLK